MPSQVGNSIEDVEFHSKRLGCVPNKGMSTNGDENPDRLGCGSNALGNVNDECVCPIQSVWIR
jgi:hypothetical protein